MDQRLVNPMACVGRTPSTSQRLRGRDQLVARYDAVDETDALGVGGTQVVAEEQQLLRPVHTDEAGNRKAAPRRADAAASEHLHEAGIVGATSRSQARPSARRRPHPPLMRQ